MHGKILIRGSFAHIHLSIIFSLFSTLRAFNPLLLFIVFSCPAILHSHPWQPIERLVDESAPGSLCRCSPVPNSTSTIQQEGELKGTQVSTHWIFEITETYGEERKVRKNRKDSEDLLVLKCVLRVTKIEQRSRHLTRAKEECSP